MASDETRSRACKPPRLTNNSRASQDRLDGGQVNKQFLTKALITLFLLSGIAIAIAVVSLGFSSMNYVLYAW